jgi:hypothetical protein
VEAIVEAQRAVAMNYFEDGSIHLACPPVKALLHIMAHGVYEGLRENDLAFRTMFTRESLLAADWYHARLRAKQTQDVLLWKRHVDASHDSATRAKLAEVSSGQYLIDLVGTIGTDPAVVRVDFKSTTN